MLWAEYTATLPESDHRRLIIALGAALREARLASQVATDNGQVEDARWRVAMAIAQLQDVERLLGA